MKQTVTFVIAACLATGCAMESLGQLESLETQPEPAPPPHDVPDRAPPPREVLTNRCNGTDASYTRTPAPTCQYTVNGSSGEGSRITASVVFQRGTEWYANCFLDGLRCSGRGTANPLACTEPDYLATNQTAATCKDTWSNNNLYVKVGEVTFHWAARDAEARTDCQNRYGDVLDDAAGRAAAACNDFATTLSSRTTRTTICCRPTPPIMPIPPALVLEDNAPIACNAETDDFCQNGFFIEAQECDGDETACTVQ